jgi:hypothetical protein
LETQPAIKFTPGTDGNGATWYLNEGEINGGALDVAHGGTGATTAAAALSNIGAAPASHTHAASDVTSGTLAVARGGTGLSASPSLLTNLASTTAANVLQASPRPGVTGVLPVANGGTGASTMAEALSNLGLSNMMVGRFTSDVNLNIETGCYFFTLDTKNLPSDIKIEYGALLTFKATSEFGIQILVSDFYQTTTIDECRVYIRPIYRGNFRRWISLSLQGLVE